MVGELQDDRDGERWAWPRLLAVGVALGLATRGFHDHFFPEVLPWWQWLLEVFGGVVLVVLALPHRRPVAEAGLRRAARWSCAVGVLLAFLALLHFAPRVGSEREAAIAVVALLGFFFAARWLPFEAEAVAGVFASEDPPTRRVGLSVLLIAVATGLVGVACHFKGTANEVSLAAWITGLVVLIVGASQWRGKAVKSGAPSPARLGPEVDATIEKLAFVTLLVLAVSLRFWAIDAVPALIDSDEGRLAGWARSMWEGGFPDVFAFGWNSFGNLSYVLHYLGIQLLGASHVNARIVSAILGVVSLIPFYFWVRGWWGNFVALVALALLLVNVEHLYWSRVGFNNIDAVLTATTLLALFARSLRTARPLDWAWVGVVAGLGFYSYHAAKLYPVLLAAAVFFYAVGVRGFVRRHLAGLGVAVVALLLTLGPQFFAMYEQWGSYVIDTTNRNDVHLALEAYARGDFAYVREHVARHVLDTLYVFLSVPQGGTVLRGATAVPFLLALGWMFWRWRDPRHVIALLWLFGILVAGGMMTSFPPSKQRMVGMLPVVAVVLAVFVGQVRVLARAATPRFAEAAVFLACLVWLNAALYQSWQTHFVLMPHRQKADVMTNVCRAMTESERPFVIYSLGANPNTNAHLIQKDCILPADPERTIFNPADDHAIVPLPPAHVGHALITVASHHAALMPLLRTIYPQAQFDILRGPGGALDLDLVRLTRAQIEETRGLRPTYRAADGSWQLGPRPNPYPPPDEPPGLLVPPEAGAGAPLIWRGQVYVPLPGRWQVRATAMLVRIDGRDAQADGAWELAAGWWPIEVEGQGGPPERRLLEWRRDAAESWVVVPRTHLSTQPWVGGLLGRYFGETFGAAGALPSPRPALFERLESVLAFEWGYYDDEKPADWFAARPGTMEWTGTVDLGEAPPRLLRLESSAPAEVFIGGERVVFTDGREPERPVEVLLPAMRGRQPLLVRAVRAEDPIAVWRLRLSWSDDGKQWTVMAGYRPSPR